MPSTLALAKPKKKGHNSLAPPQNVTVAYLAYKVREEAVFKNAFDAINAGEFSFPCPIGLLLVPEPNQANARARQLEMLAIPVHVRFRRVSRARAALDGSLRTQTYC